MSDINKQAAISQLEAFNTGNVDLLDDVVAIDYLNHNTPPGAPNGLAGLKAVVGMVRAAFPDYRYTVDDVLAEGDRVVLRLTAEGTQTGTAFGMFPPSGKHVTWQEIHIWRCVDGKMVEHWGCRDDLKLLEQIGVIDRFAGAGAGAAG